MLGVSSDVVASGIILSCGASQLYGLVKGTLDLRKYVNLRSKIHKWEEIQRLYISGRQDKLTGTKAFTQLKMKAPNLNTRELCSELCRKADRRLFELGQDKIATQNSLKIDLLSTIPLIGVIAAYKLGTQKQNACEENLSHIEFSVSHALNNWKNEINSKIFYPLSGKSLKAHPKMYESERIKIPVASRCINQDLDAIFLQGRKASLTGPVVVIFHGNGMTCDDVYDWGKWYQKQGYNVLMPTMGGYPGSPGVVTSEVSSYQDVEAIKKYLDRRGIKQAGYHGISIGGTLAFQAATGASEAGVKSLFVVADQTLTKGTHAIENFLRNRESEAYISFGKGLAHAAMPFTQVYLSKTLSVTADGLNNLRKAQLLRECGIPMIAIKSSRDHFMGQNKEGVHFQHNFADDLIAARYRDLAAGDKVNFLITLDSGHVGCFVQSEPAQKKMSDFLKMTSK